MEMNLDLAVKKAQLKFDSENVQVNTQVIDVTGQLIGMLKCDDWSNEQVNFLQGWLKKIDVASKHYIQYQLDWKLYQPKTTLPNHYYDLTLVIALLYLRKITTESKATGLVLKCCNVIYKLLDCVTSEVELSPVAVDAHLQSLLNTIQTVGKDASELATENISGGAVLPVTVLFWEGPIARAYLETIKSMGLKVNKIIKMVSNLDLVTKKPVGKWLPQSMRNNYAANKQFKQIFYWPHLYQSKYGETIKKIQNRVSLSYGFDNNTLLSATQNKDLMQYTEKLDTLSISGLKDSKLFEKISQEQDNLFLFTGGGIVPNELLSIEQKKLIHVHPGYLPEIRGADCVLWSQLLTQRLSASAFFLAPGIDVGDVIFPCWLPELRLNLSEQVENKVKYRMIYGFLDPWVRSFTLKQTIISTNGLTEMTSKAQTESDGMTYHFMHEKIKQQAFKKFGW